MDGQRERGDEERVVTAVGEDVRVPPQRVKFTPYISAATHARARRVVAGLHGTENQLSLNDLVDMALRRECARIERLHNRGQEFEDVERMPGAGGRRTPHDATPSD